MRFARQLFSLLALPLLFACSPALDWREYRMPDAGFSILLPQKPAQAERRLQTPAGEVGMRMYSARVGEHVFAAGFADFSRPVDAALLDAMRDVLAANMGGQVANEKAVESGAFKGREFSAAGMLGRGKDAKPGVMRARIYANDRRYVQLVSLGPADELATGDVDLFLTSLKAD
jgi:hypothetical protein